MSQSSSTGTTDTIVSQRSSDTIFSQNTLNKIHIVESTQMENSQTGICNIYYDKTLKTEKGLKTA